MRLQVVLPVDGTVVAPGGKFRESGMPQEEVWSSFFNVGRILNRMQINSKAVDAADFACGYGTFTIPADPTNSGNHILYPKMTQAVENRARRLRLVNVRLIVRDLMREGSGLEDESVDYVMIFKAKLVKPELEVACYGSVQEEKNRSRLSEKLQALELRSKISRIDVKEWRGYLAQELLSSQSGFEDAHDRLVGWLRGGLRKCVLWCGSASPIVNVLRKNGYSLQLRYAESLSRRRRIE